MATRLLFNWFSVIVMSVINSEKCFKNILTCSNKPGCALDNPTEIMKNIENKFLCAYICRAREDCVSFNYLEMPRSCLIFNSTPYKILEVDKCYGFDVSYPVGKTERQYPYEDNLSKYRRTCQSTTSYAGNIPKWSWLAVDGFYGIDRANGDCSQTNQADQFNNWFMVDLVYLVSISYVRVLSSIIASTKNVKYQNLTIGVTNTSWQVQPPIRGTYPLCGVYLGPAPNATWIQINCQPLTFPSRFVIIHQVPANSPDGGYLYLCELQVFGKMAIV